MDCGISQEYTWFGVGFKFVVGLKVKIWVTKNTLRQKILAIIN